MKKFVDPPRALRTDVLRKRFKGLRFDLCKAPKVLEKRGNGLGTDVGDGFQLGGKGAAAARVAVEGDGEAMGFVADLLEELQGGGPFAEVEGMRVFGNINLLKSFGKGNDSGLVVDAYLLKRLHRGIELPFAPVNDDEVGQGLLGGDKAVVVAVDDLLHGGKVVNAFHGLDVEVAVLLFGRVAPFETDHGGDRVGALEVGVVKAFDVHGDLFEPEVLLQVDECAAGRFSRRGFFVEVLLFAEPSVVERHVQELFFVP